MAASRSDLFRADPKPESEKPEVPSRYRVHLVGAVKITERGLVYRHGQEHYLLAWGQVERAFAAEVGEPEGVRTIVFDLAVELSGVECVVCRFDAEPGEEAMKAARAIERGIGCERCSASLRNLAEEGLPTRWYPDLEAFQEAALESLRFG